MSLIPDLTPSQLLAYHTRLGLDATDSYSLQELLTANTRSIPFESLSLHYSSSPGVKITLPDICQKIILNNRGRGGYCMENNTLFLALLKSRGFDVWPAGARVSYEVDTQGKDKSGRFLGWNHMVLIVDDDKLVDVGFGGK
jgi:arylamine N-acetyltransferase